MEVKNFTKILTKILFSFSPVTGNQKLPVSENLFKDFLLAAQAVNPGKNIVGNNGVALMLQKSFLEKIEDRIRADNGVDNILELYERTLQHSTATGTFTVYERITKIPSNLKIKEQKQSQREEEVKIKEKKEVVDIKPLQSAVPIVIGVGVGTLVIGKIFS